MQQDTTLYLLVDEIHLKPYFYFKGDNILGLFDNNNETIRSAFPFMLSNVFSQYKDVVRGAFNTLPDFFVQASKIVVDF